MRDHRRWEVTGTTRDGRFRRIVDAADYASAVRAVCSKCGPVVLALDSVRLLLTADEAEADRLAAVAAYHSIFRR